jgi:spore germination protein GerM
MINKRWKKLNWPIAGWLAALVFFALTAAVLYWSSPSKAPEVQVYFFQGDRLTAVTRPLPPDRAPLEVALRELLKGPSEAEKAAGLSTQLPAGIKIRALRSEREIATIDFSGRLEAYGGGSSRVEGLVAQIVYTATAVPGINKAWIWLAGQKEVVLGGEGLVLDKPLGRGDLAY